MWNNQDGAKSRNKQQKADQSGYYLRLENDQTRTGFQSQKECNHHPVLKHKQLLWQWYLGCFKSIVSSKQAANQHFSENHYLAIKQAQPKCWWDPQKPRLSQTKKVRIRFTVGLQFWMFMKLTSDFYKRTKTAVTDHLQFCQHSLMKGKQVPWPLQNQSSWQRLCTRTYFCRINVQNSFQDVN